MLGQTCDVGIYGMTQMDELGRPLFVHRCRDKWRFLPQPFESTVQNFQTNHYFPDLPHEDFCFQCLRELETLWPPSRRV